MAHVGADTVRIQIVTPTQTLFMTFISYGMNTFIQYFDNILFGS